MPCRACSRRRTGKLPPESAPRSRLQRPGGPPRVLGLEDAGRLHADPHQGSCGSCWAFATVGAMESAVLIDSGLSQDLSEQYLVSCNLSGWSCSGGWFAHDYHWNRPRPQRRRRAVLESAKPYTATNAACGGPFSQPYVLQGWYYVDPSTTVPATAAIKQAIMNYGPVSVAVYVNSAFQLTAAACSTPAAAAS